MLPPYRPVPNVGLVVEAVPWDNNRVLQMIRIWMLDGTAKHEEVDSNQNLMVGQFVSLQGDAWKAYRGPVDMLPTTRTDEDRLAMDDIPVVLCNGRLVNNLIGNLGLAPDPLQDILRHIAIVTVYWNGKWDCSRDQFRITTFDGEQYFNSVHPNIREQAKLGRNPRPLTPVRMIVETELSNPPTAIRAGGEPDGHLQHNGYPVPLMNYNFGTRLSNEPPKPQVLDQNTNRPFHAHQEVSQNTDRGYGAQSNLTYRGDQDHDNGNYNSGQLQNPTISRPQPTPTTRQMFAGPPAYDAPPPSYQAGEPSNVARQCPREERNGFRSYSYDNERATGNSYPNQPFPSNNGGFQASMIGGRSQGPQFDGGGSKFNARPLMEKVPLDAPQQNQNSDGFPSINVRRGRPSGFCAPAKKGGPDDGFPHEPERRSERQRRNFDPSPPRRIRSVRDRLLENDTCCLGAYRNRAAEIEDDIWNDKPAENKPASLPTQFEATVGSFGFGGPSVSAPRPSAQSQLSARNLRNVNWSDDEDENPFAAAKVVPTVSRFADLRIKERSILGAGNALNRKKAVILSENEDVWLAHGKGAQHFFIQKPPNGFNPRQLRQGCSIAFDMDCGFVGTTLNKHQYRVEYDTVQIIDPFVPIKREYGQFLVFDIIEMEKKPRMLAQGKSFVNVGKGDIIGTAFDTYSAVKGRHESRIGAWMCAGDADRWDQKFHLRIKEVYYENDFALCQDIIRRFEAGTDFYLSMVPRN